MAFGQVQQINYGHAISTLDDAQAVTQVQTALQSRFDVNNAKVDEMIQKVTSIPLLREKDKKYLGDKLNGLLNTVNANLKASKGRGLLSNSVTAELNRYITSAIDDNVKEQLKNSSNIINFQKGVAELKEKKPDTYNNGNYQYALDKAGYESYINGNTDKLGSLEYNPYQDVMGNAMEKAVKLKQLKGDEEIEMVNPNNPKEIIKRKISGLKPEEIINNIPGFLSEQDKKQIAIDGYIQFRGNKAEAGKQFDAYVDKKAELIKGGIEEQEAIINDSGSKTPNQITDAKNKKAQYERDAENLVKMSLSVKRDDIDTIGYTLKMADVTNSMASLFSGRESRTVDVNESYYKDANLAIELEKLEISKAEALQKGLKAKKNADGTITYEGNSADFNPTVVYDENVPEVEKEGNFVKNVQTEHNKNYNLVNDIALSAYRDSSTSDSKKTQFSADMKVNGYMYNNTVNDFIKDPNYKGKSYSKAAAMSKAFFHSNLDDVYPEKAKQLVETDEKRTILAHGLEKAYKIGRTSIDTNSIIDDLQMGVNTLESNNIFRALDATEYTERFINNMLPVPIPTESARKRKEVAEEMKNFISKNGGIDNLKVKAKNNHVLLMQAQELFKKAANSDAALYLRSNGIDKQTGDIAKNLKENGMESFVQSKQAMQVTGDSANNIIDLIPSFERTGSKFDKKAGNVTAEKTTNGYVITQFQGYDKKGERLESVAHITNESAAAKYIDSNVGQDETYISTKDVPNGYKIESKVKPQFSSSDNAGQVLSADSKFKAIISDPNMYNIAMPYNTSQSTVKKIQAELYGTELENTYLEVANKIISGIDNNKYSVAIKKNENTENWITEIYKDGNFLMSSVVGQSEKLNKDYMNLVKLYPHLVISESLVSFVKRDKNNITKL